MNHKGQSNPFFGKTHKTSSKEAIGKTQKLRYSKLRELAKKLDEQALDERISRIMREQLTRYTNQTSDTGYKVI